MYIIININVTVMQLILDHKNQYEYECIHEYEYVCKFGKKNVYECEREYEWKHEMNLKIL